MLAALALAADLKTTLHLQDRTDLRWRIVDCGGGAPCLGLDLATMPAARLEVASRRTTLSVSYAPMFTLREPFTRAPDGDLYGVRFSGPYRNVEQLQAGSITLSYANKRVAIGLFQDATFGDLNYTYLTPTSTLPSFVPPPAHPLLPPGQTQTLLYGSSRSAVSFAYTSRHTRASAFASYSVSGGLDERSKLVVPLISATRNELAFEARVAERVWLETRGGPSASNSTPRPCNPETGGPQLPAEQLPPGTQFPWPTCAPVVVAGDLREVLRWQPSRRLTTQVSGGVAVTAVKLRPELTPNMGIPPEDFRWRPYPDVRIDVTYALAAVSLQSRSMLELRARVSPVLDFRYALPDQRAELGAVWMRIRGRWESRAEVVYVQSIPGVSYIDSTYVGLTAEAFYAVTKRFDLGLGARSAWQWDPTFGFFFSNGFFATFRWREPAIRL